MSLEDGIILLRSGETEVCRMDSPVMIDDAQAFSSDIEMKLTSLKDNENNHEYRITVTPSAEWLKDSARVYPVSIDPTISFGGTNSNTNYLMSSTYVDQYQPNTSFNSQANT